MSNQNSLQDSPLRLKSTGTSPKIDPNQGRKLPMATLNSIRDATIQSSALRLRAAPRSQRNEACNEFSRTLSREIETLEKEIRRPENDQQLQVLRADIVRESLKLGDNIAKLINMTIEKK